MACIDFEPTADCIISSLKAVIQSAETSAGTAECKVVETPNKGQTNQP